MAKLDCEEKCLLTRREVIWIGGVLLSELGSLTGQRDSNMVREKNIPSSEPRLLCSDLPCLEDSAPLRSSGQELPLSALTFLQPPGWASPLSRQTGGGILMLAAGTRLADALTVIASDAFVTQNYRGARQWPLCVLTKSAAVAGESLGAWAGDKKVAQRNKPAQPVWVCSPSEMWFHCGAALFSDSAPFFSSAGHLSTRSA